MNKRKILSLSLAAVLLMGTLSGCKTEEDFTAKTPTDSGSTETEFVFDYSAGLSDEGGFKNIKAENIANPGTYLGIAVPKSEITVKDEELQTELNALLELFVTYETLKEGTVADKSAINIDYVGSVDKVPFDGGSTNGAGTDVVIGETQYIEGFLSQLIGHKVGETFDINVTFPADYDNGDLAGKDAVFNITINSMQGEKQFPELTDAFVEENFGEQPGYHSVKDVTEAFTKEIETRKQTEYVWNTLIKNSVVKEIPQEILDHTVGRMLSYHNSSAKQYGMTLTAFLEATGMGTIEEFKTTQKDEIKSQAETTMILLAIAEKEGITATEEDIKTALGTEDTTEAEKFYGKAYINQVIITGKAEELVREKAVREA